MLTLFENGSHKNIFWHDLGGGAMIQSTQHVIVDGDDSIILDPGGHKIYAQLFGELAPHLPPGGLRYVFLSHQDPDIVAAINGWLMVTDATAFASSLWMRFIPHFGVDELVVNRMKPIPDEGMAISFGSSGLKFIAAPFLHSAGNFHVYDPVSKILYTGDLGASIGADYMMVEDFEAHIPSMKGFHQRYMPCNAILRRFVKTARNLDVECIAPQHGALFKGKELVGKLLDWLDQLDAGIDLMPDVAFPIPD